MRGEVLNGSCCTTSGCQSVTITHLKGGDIEASTFLCNNVELGTSIELENNECTTDITFANPSFDASVIRKETPSLQTSISIMCRTSQGRWEYLLVKEGEIMLIDGQHVVVKRKGT